MFNRTKFSSCFLLRCVVDLEIDAVGVYVEMEVLVDAGVGLEKDATVSAREVSAR